MASSTEPPGLFQSQRHCYSILDETLSLAVLDPLTLGAKDRSRLEHLLLSYFQDNETGGIFRSMICFGCNNRSVSTVDFNNFVVLPGSHYAMELRAPTPHVPVPIQLQQVSATAKTNLHLNTLSHAHASVDFVLQYVSAEYYANNDEIAFHNKIPLKWKNGIIGKVDRATLTIVDTPSLEELQHRIRQALDFSIELKKTNPYSFFFSLASALIWKESTPAPPPPLEKVDYTSLYLKGCSDFPDYLADLLGPDRYLDELAGIEVGHAYPEVEARFKKMYDQAPPRHVDGHDLKLGEHTSEIGGTVVALHQYISPSFLAYYTVDHDASCAYMTDERSSHKKERKIRVASPDHVDTKPVWLQFGDTADVYLYLSQKASVAEEKWLSIVNFVMNLLVEFVNKRIKEFSPGRKLEGSDLMRTRSYGVVVSSASNPIQGNYGWHRDGKNGIVDEGDPQYNSSQLMVPTLCIQNFAHSNTRIEWAPLSDPTYIAGTVHHECVLFHLQLLYVNEKYKHHVSHAFLFSIFGCFHYCITHLPFLGPVLSMFSIQVVTDAGSVPPELMFDIGMNLDLGLDEMSPGDEAELPGLFYEMDLVEPAATLAAAHEDRLHSDSESSATSKGPNMSMDDAGGFLDEFEPIPPKRIAFSARESPKILQARGIGHVQDDVENKKILSDPVIFGFNSDYRYFHIFGATSELHQRQVGSDRNSSLAPITPRQRRTFKSVFKVTESRKGNPPKIPGLNLSKYTYPLRVTDKAIWPRSNEKKVASVKSASQMFISRPVVDWMREDGIVPVITHPLRKTGTVTVAFGPYLDCHHQPHSPGTCFRSSSVYLHFGMRLHADHNEAWRSNADTLSSLFLRLPEKNSLPLTTPVVDRKSPLSEMRRIVGKLPRGGFDIYRSGGNPTVKGNAPPGAGTKSAGEGAFFEHAQCIKNAYNMALESVSESGRPLAVFGAGPLMPKEFLDDSLRKEIGDAEQAFYFGVYTVVALGERQALTWPEIGLVFAEYKPVFSDLSVSNLRFLLLPHRAYRLLPVEYPDIDGGYKQLSVDARDNRRPLFNLPEKVSFQKAFDVDTSCSLVDPPFDESTMLRQWYERKGHYEFLTSPFEEGTSRAPTKNSTSVDWDFTNDETVAVAHAEKAFAPLLLGSATSGLNDLAGFEAKSSTIEECFWIAMVCGVASFCRELEVHVAVDGTIGPLVDADPAYHRRVDGTHLESYDKVFCTSTSGKTIPYLGLLGLEMQRSPLTSPVRVYDANRRILLESTGGGNLRSDRAGLAYVKRNIAAAVDHLFQSVLVEVVRAPVLLEWNQFWNKGVGGLHLPVLSNIESFLGFLESIRHHQKWRTNNHLLQTQYELHEAFKKSKAFDRVFRYLAANLGTWLQESIDSAAEHEQSTDYFSANTLSLSTFFGRSENLGSNGDKVPFFCQNVLSNMNELYADWPFGIPQIAISGFGGMFGIRRLQRGLGGKVSMLDILNMLMHHVKGRSDSELAVVGLFRNEAGDVLIRANSRPLTCLEPEHWCCLLFPFTERMIGGTRGLGTRYQVTSSHCNPVRTLQLSKDFAEGAIKAYRHLVDSGEWQKMAEKVPCVSGSMSQISLCSNTSEAVKGGDQANRGAEMEDASSEDSSDDEQGGENKSVEVMEDSGRSVDMETSVYSSDSSFADTANDRKRKHSKSRLTPSFGLRSRLPLDLTRIRGIRCKTPPEKSQKPPEPRACNLMLGMIYGNFGGTAEEIGDMTEHTTQLRRDTARCQVTEECTGRDVFTLDNRAVESQRMDRHVVQDLKDIILEDRLMASIKGHVHQICLDHFWFNSVYWDTKIGPTFFTKSLPLLKTLLQPNGVIYIGLSVHLLLHVLKNEVHLNKYFVTSLVHGTEVNEIDLVRGSHLIDDALYACPTKFGNKNQNPESALGVTFAMLRQTCPGTCSTIERVAQLRKLTGDRDPEEYRFIKFANLED